MRIVKVDIAFSIEGGKKYNYPNDYDNSLYMPFFYYDHKLLSGYCLALTSVADDHTGIEGKTIAEAGALIDAWGAELGKTEEEITKAKSVLTELEDV